MASTTRGSIKISTANGIGAALVDVLGGEGYKPDEWEQNINLCGIHAADIESALENIEEDAGAGTERGSILLSTANGIGEVLNKKFNTSRGFSPREWASAASKLEPLPERTASGAIAHIEDGADGVPLKNWLVTLPASLDGYTEVNGVKSGKNISSVSEYPSNPYIFWGTNFTDMVSFLNTLGSGTYTISFDFEVATVPDSGDIQYGLPYIRALVGGSYVNLTNYSISAASSVSVGDIFRVSASFTLTAERVGNVSNCYIYCDRKDTHSGIGRGSYNLINAQIEVGSTATAYEAYTAPTTYTASLGRTIYGGTADIITGEGSDGYIKYIIDGVNNYAINVSGTNFNIIPYGLFIDGTISKWVCDEITASSTNFSYNSNQGFIFIRQAGWSSLTGVTDVASFNTYCQEHPITLILPKITPEEFTFEPTTPTPETALGINNFWSDQGESAATYRKDLDIPDPVPGNLLGMNNGNNNEEESEG